MDPIVLVIIIAVGMPIAVVLALMLSARWRGPAVRSESRRPVESLVTDVIKDEPPPEETDEDTGPDFRIDSPPPEPDPGLPGHEER